MLPPVLYYDYSNSILYSIAANLSIHRKKEWFYQFLLCFFIIPPKSFLRLTFPAKFGTPGPRRFTALPG